MNDNELMNNSNNQTVGTYRATSNLNTAIENPQINIGSAVGVNIQDVHNDDISTLSNDYQNNTLSSNDFNNSTLMSDNLNNNQNNTNNLNVNSYTQSVSNNVQNYDNSGEQVDQAVTSFINSNNASNSVNSYENNDNTFVTNSAKVVYEPTLEEKKMAGYKFSIPKELKVMFFIVFVLFIFIMAIPGIYDFFKELGLVVSG